MDVVEIQKANEYFSNGDLLNAEKIYKNILERDENNSYVMSMLGILYLNKGRIKAAKSILEKSYSIKPTQENTEYLGLSYFFLKEQNKATELFEKIIDTTDNFDVFEKYIACLQRKNDNKKAYEVAQLAYSKFPLRPEIISQYADCCLSYGKFNEAEIYSGKVTRFYPKYGDGWVVRGLLYEVYYHDDEMAKGCFKQALACGQKRKAYYNLGINSARSKDYPQALKYLKKIYRGFDEDSWMNFTLSGIYFRQRKFKKAYKYYISREVNCGPEELINKLKNKWDGKTYKNETILVFCDQGYGDTFMFSRYIKFLTKKFKYVKVLIREEMSGLLKRAFKDEEKIKVYSVSKKVPSYDKSVILSHLPYYLNMDIKDIPYSEGYLYPDKKLVQKYKKIISSDKLKVGICWEAAGTGLRDMLHRTLDIDMFSEILSLDKVKCFSLQVKPVMDKYKEYSNLVHLGDYFSDFDETAGALSNLDVLVTVDTAIANLAGALGVKTFLILPYYSDWRWFDNDKRTEWYDSVTIFKQSDAKSYENVFMNIKNELMCLASE